MGVAMQRRSANTITTTTVGGGDGGVRSKNGSAMESLRYRRRLRRKRSSGGLRFFEEMRIDANTQVVLVSILLFGFAAATIFKMSLSIFGHKSVEPANPHYGRRERFGSEKHHNPYQDGHHRRGQRYKIPDAMEEYGDKSKHYARLREEYDALLPRDPQRSRKAVQSLHKRTYKTITKGATVPTYDIYNCPVNPPLNYPMQWNILDVLDNWNPDDTNPQTHIYQGLCVFDFEYDFEKALNYREAELPFIIKNDPEVLRTTERWNYPGYMEKLMGDVEHRTEYSENNHFMYFVPPDRPGSRPKRGKPHAEAPRGWKPPTKDMRMTYEEWLFHADTTDDDLGPDKPHWYHRLIGCGSMGEDCDEGSSEYLFDELTFFQPVEDKLYVVEPEEQKGIHCRFGMKGVIAENHFDATRNAIVLLGGERRYILSHPDQCHNLALFPLGHPSARHSATDWSNPDLETFPEFADAMVNEVVMQAGDVMYLPTNWFHYIISLELNYQCNARSGIGAETYQTMEDCGF